MLNFLIGFNKGLARLSDSLLCNFMLLALSTYGFYLGLISDSLCSILLGILGISVGVFGIKNSRKF